MTIPTAPSWEARAFLAGKGDSVRIHTAHGVPRAAQAMLCFPFRRFSKRSVRKSPSMGTTGFDGSATPNGSHSSFPEEPAFVGAIMVLLNEVVDEPTLSEPYNRMMAQCGLGEVWRAKPFVSLAQRVSGS